MFDLQSLFKKARTRMSAGAALDKVRKYIESNQNELAVQALSVLIQQDESNPESYYLLGDAYLGMGQPRQAAESFIQAISYHSQGLLQRKEIVDYVTKDGSTGDQGLDALVERVQSIMGDVDMFLYDCLLGLACAYADAKAFDKAIISLKKAIEVAPENRIAYSELGYVYLGAGNCKGAIACFNSVLGINSEDHQALHDLSLAYMELNDSMDCSVKSIRCIEKAMELAPKEALYYARAAEIAHFTGHPRMVSGFLKKAEECSDTLDAGVLGIINSMRSSVDGQNDQGVEP